ncbi:MAG TPA: hypothetical protein VKX25_00290 [Bryobacteraceae bacterium]|jgi:hypothetical protein|nr:hypothetical protein [Bryobacteraceae bacterium]
MSNKTNRVFRVAAIAAGLGIAALQASAAQGTFNLPVEAHWGRIVLEPGIHRVDVPTAELGQKIVYLRTGTQTRLTVPVTTQPATGTRSYLRLVKVDGAYYVDAYQSQFDGQKYLFARPKPAPSDEASAAPEQETLVEVDSK